MSSNQANQFLASLPHSIFCSTRHVSHKVYKPELIRTQCVILTVRPVLFSLLKPLLASNAPIPDGRHSSSPFESMLKMCIESAVQILKIMSILKQQMMCGVFVSSVCDDMLLT